MSFYNLITGGSVNMGTLVTDVLFVVCVVILLGRFELSARALVSRVLEAAGLLIIECSLDVLCYCFDLSDYPGPTFISLFAVLALYALAQSRLSHTDRLARSATFASIFVLVVSITRTVIPAVTWLERLSFGYFVPSALSYVCMVLSALCIRHFSVEKCSFVPWRYLPLILVIDVFGSLAGWTFVGLHDSYDFLDFVPTSGSFMVALSRDISQASLVVCTGFMALVLIAYFMFYVLAREHDRRAELLVTRKNEIDNANTAMITKSMYDSLRAIRHEIKNHDAYMAALIEAGDYDRLHEFLSTYALLHEEATHYVASGNPIVDAVVNSKTALARSKGLTLDAMLAVPPELPFDEEDIFSLLANLLDNAIEGTTLADGSESRPIQLKVRPEAGYYFISVTNPCDPNQVRHGRSGELVTSKRDREIHGYGTRIIKRIADKYHGHASFSVQGEAFVANVMLVRDEKREAEL